MTISSPGIGSGLDVNSIITQLMAIERKPLDALQTKSAAIQTQISEYGKIKSAMSTLRDAALKLTDSTTWGMTLGASSDAASVGVGISGSASVGNYSVQVLALARAQSLASQPFAASTAAPGAGSLHIETGTWGPGQTTFTPGAAPGVDISVEATDTLAQVRDKINAAGAGVTATILTDTSGSRLLLRSSATGVANAFRTSVTDADGNNADALGLSALAYDPSAAAAVMTQAEAASDASAIFNGLAISSASNTLANIVDGVTLTLSRVTTAPIEIAVTQDTEGMKKSVQGFVDAYNALSKLIAGQLKYDATNKTSGPLQGDSAAVGIQRQMRALVGASSAASSVFARLSDVGLELQKDGSLAVDAGKLDAALAKLPEMRKFFANSDLLVPENNGIARQFRAMGDEMLSVDGVITTRSDGLSKRIEMNRDQQASLETRLAQTEQRLRAQYTALDTKLGQLSAISAYVTQQMAMFTNNSSKS